MNQPAKTSLTVIVPVYNEEHLVEESLGRLLVLEQSERLEKIQVVVVDDASGDGTPQVLERLRDTLPRKSRRTEWEFIRHRKNTGKGGAIRTGLERAESDVTIIHDGDLEYHPKDILRMMPLFIEEGADAVYGSRFTTHEYRRVLLFRHELGNRLVTFLCNLVSNLNLTDMETCYKAVRTALLKSIPLKSNDFRFEPEITIKLAKRRARVFEIPINYSGRTYAEGKKINWIDGLKAVAAIVRFSLSDDIFTQDVYGSQILARLSRAQHFNAWMADTIRPYVGDSVLEIGSGIGNLTVQLLPRKTYTATDINPLYLQIMNNLKENKPYLSVNRLDLNDVSEFKKAGKRFDTAICLNVIEHLEDEHQAMRNIADLLESRGRAIVLVPRGKLLFGSLDEVLGHKKRYEIRDLRSMASAAGLSVEKIIPFNRTSTIPWYVNACILKRRHFGLFQITMFNLLVPLIRHIDAYLPWASLSLIAVLKKG